MTQTRPKHEWDTRFTAETDMIEMLEPEFVPIWLIWVRRETPVDTDMTETTWPELTQIWLRHHKKISVQVWFKVSQSYQFQQWILRLTHIGPNSGSSVSIISISTVYHASHSYRSLLDRFGTIILGTFLYFHIYQRKVVTNMILAISIQSILTFLCSDRRMNTFLKTFTFKNHSLTTGSNECIVYQWKIFDTMKFFIVDFTQFIRFPDDRQKDEKYSWCDPIGQIIICCLTKIFIPASWFHWVTIIFSNF